MEQTQAGLDKLPKGDLPDGANITKVIVNGYKDGVLIAGAAYLGPAASVGKAVGGPSSQKLLTVLISGSILTAKKI